MSADSVLSAVRRILFISADSVLRVVRDLPRMARKIFQVKVSKVNVI